MVRSPGALLVVSVVVLIGCASGERSETEVQTPPYEVTESVAREQPRWLDTVIRDVDSAWASCTAAPDRRFPDAWGHADKLDAVVGHLDLGRLQ